MSMKRNLIIIGAVAILAVAVVLLIPLLKPKAPVTDPSVYDERLITNYYAQDVTSVDIQRPNDSLSVYKDANDAWRVKGREQVDLDETAVNEFLNSLSFIRAESIITNDMSDLSEFGCQDPTTATVHIQFSDDTSVTYCLGDQTSSLVTYYLVKEGKDDVYEVLGDVGTKAKYTIENLVGKPTLSYSIDQLNGVTLYQSDGAALTLEQRTENVIGIYDWWMNEPYKREIAMDSVGTLMDSIGAVNITDLVTVGPTQEQLESFGLTNEENAYGYKLLTTDGKTIRVRVGSSASIYTSYVMVDGIDAVFTATTDLFDFVDTSAYSLTDKTLYLINVINLDSIEFDGFGQSGKLDIQNIETVVTPLPTSADKTANPDATQEPAATPSIKMSQQYKLDGKDVTNEEAIAWIKVCLGIEIHSYVDQDYIPSGPVRATIHYAVNIPGYDDVTIQFYDCGLDYYAAVINGECLFKVLKEEVDTVASTMGQFKAGELATE